MENSHILIREALKTLLTEKKYTALRDILSTLNPVDIAQIFEEMADEKLPLLFRLLPKELAADTFVEMEDDSKELLIRGFSDTELKEIIDEIYIDDAVDIVEEMPANVVKRILAQADSETRKLINEILNYPEDSAGSIMTTEYVSLRPNMTVEEAIKRIRRIGVDKETIYTCYVTLDNRTLIGISTIKDLLLADEDIKVADLMETNVIAVNTLDDKEKVAQMFDKYDFMAMPVVDREGRLVGIVTVDDAMDVMKEEATEDISKMAAVTPSDKPYFKTGVFETFLHRIPWLLILMVSATFSGLIINHYETTLLAGGLAAFMPMLMNTGGNSGGQSSTTVIRGISLNEIKFSDMFKVLFKEFRVSVLCSVALAIANFAKLMLFDRTGVAVALVVSITLIINVIASKIIGSALPLFAKKVGFDPTVMSSPFVTTIVDALSLLIYFSVASMILGI